MSGGTVNISRGLWDDEDFPDEKFSEREAWIWMIAEAAWRPRKKRVGVVVFDLQRGQLALSVRFAAAAWGWSKSRVQRFLKRLENRDKVRTESGTGATLVTICKYEEYQFGGTAAGQQRDTAGTEAGQTINRETYLAVADSRAGARETPKTEPDTMTWREQMLEAIGVGDVVSGRSSLHGATLGTSMDMHEAQCWETDLGLSRDEIMTRITETMASRPPTFLPRKFSYFTPAMRELAAAKARPSLQPAEGDHYGNSASQSNAPRQSRRSGAHDSLLRGFQSAANDID